MRFWIALLFYTIDINGWSFIDYSVFCVICQHSGGNWYLDFVFRSCSSSLIHKKTPINDFYLTLYSCMQHKKCIQLVSDGSLVLDEDIWPLTSCLNLWISSRWNRMIFSASSKLCCVIKMFIPAEAAPEARKNKIAENLQLLRCQCYHGPCLSRCISRCINGHLSS